MANKDEESGLSHWRGRIDDLDRQLVALLNERARAVVEIGKIKRQGDTPIYAPDRERQVLDQIRRYNQGPIPDSCLVAIWRELMSGSFVLERPLQVGYLGPKGSFSHLAARRKFGAAVEYADMEDIPSVFEEIARGRIDLGLVPIENSAIGGIGETLEAFLDSPVRVFAEVLINVHHNLMSRGPVDQIRKIYSKPEVFSQCRKWLATHLRDAERFPVASSSRAAELAGQQEGTAAIASSLAAEVYDLKTHFSNIEDNPNNITRFFVISLQQAKPTGQDKTAVMFTTAHKSGALAEVLDVFRDQGLNLTHIDKTPSRRVNWEYYFFVDFLGHESDPQVAAALDIARQRCLQLSILGSFPRAQEVL